MIKTNKYKKAQEEMVGFALIIIVVAVILLFFLSFSIKRQNTEAIESHEVEGFIHSILQETTSCENSYESNFQPLRKVILYCNENKVCLSGQDPCNILNDQIKTIMDESWKVSSENPLKGYNIEISSQNENILNLSKGNQTKVYKEASSTLDDSQTKVNVKIYY